MAIVSIAIGRKIFTTVMWHLEDDKEGVRRIIADRTNIVRQRANIVIVNMSFCQTKYFFLDKNIYTLMILNTKLFYMQTPALVPCMLKLIFYLHHFIIY